MTGDFHILGSNFNRKWGRGISFHFALNFMTFGKTSQKLWPNMLLFSPARQSGQI